MGVLNSDLPPFDPRPVVLEGSYARLEPITPAHAPGLLEAARDPAVWQWLTIPQPTTLDAMSAFVSAALTNQQAGTDLVFAIVRRADDRVVGSTRYMDIQRADRGLEIGWTWNDSAVWRTALNSECKLLLLTHAFEALGAERVQLKTDLRNERSQRAIERIGAVKEGVLRKHKRTHAGYLRDSVMYSVVRAEWPGVKAKLVGFVAPARSG